MKIFFLIIASAPIFSFAVNKNRVPQQAEPAIDKLINTCEEKAMSEITTRFGKNFKDYADVEGASCQKTISKKKKEYYSCEVNVVGRDGAGDKTYAVMLNSSCDKTRSAFLLFEE